MRSISVKVVGCGGIGGALLPILCRYLNFAVAEYSTVEVSLIDGDAYESKNAARQAFDSEINKAQATANKLSAEFPRIFFRPQSMYLNTANVASQIHEGDVVFSCVDNHATRKLLNDRCQELQTVVMISGGNRYTDGNVQVHVRENGKDLTLPIANEYHPEIREPSDENPGDKPPVEPGGCEALVESAPQLLITNNVVAAAMLTTFYSQQQGNLDYDEVYLDVMSSQNRKVKRARKETVEA